MRVAREIKLTDGLRESLEKAARARTSSVRFALRAKMILMAADGMPDLLIAEQLNVSRQSVARWRGRFLLQGGSKASGRMLRGQAASQRSPHRKCRKWFA